MIEALNRARPRLFSGGFLRRLRAITDLLHAIDLQGLQVLISKFEASQSKIETSQCEIKALLEARRSALPLISPLELTTHDRYELEARCRALTNPVYLGDHTAICRLLGYYKFYVDTTDTGFSSHVLLEGCWEMWLTIFFARNLQPGMTVIDVGANFGYYTLLFGALVGEKGHVYAIEPNPNVVPKLRRSVELNGLTPRTTIVSAAAGSVDGGEVTLYAPHGEPKNATIVTSPDVVSPNSGVIYQVPQVTVDQVVAGAPHVDIVKIDAEGAEQTIIAGMMQTLTRDRPGLLLEFNAARYGNARAFIDQLMTIYDRMRCVDYEGNPVPVTESEVVSDRWGEDWLLFFDCSPPIARANAIGIGVSSSA